MTYVFVNVFGVDKSAVPQRNPLLLLVEFHMLGIRNMLLRFRIHIQQPGYLAALHQMLADDFFRILGLYLRIKRIVRQNLNDRSLLTEAEAAGLQHLDLVLDAGANQCVPQIFHDSMRIRGQAAGTAADQYMIFTSHLFPPYRTSRASAPSAVSPFFIFLVTISFTLASSRRPYTAGAFPGTRI